MQAVITLTVEQPTVTGTPALSMMAQNGPVVFSMMMTSIPWPCAVVVAEDHRQHKVITWIPKFWFPGTKYHKILDLLYGYYAMYRLQSSVFLHTCNPILVWYILSHVFGYPHYTCLGKPSIHVRNNVWCMVRYTYPVYTCILDAVM